MLAGLEMMTGLTIEKGQMLPDEDDGIEHQSYRVMKQPNTGARQRLTDYDSGPQRNDFRTNKKDDWRCN